MDLTARPEKREVPTELVQCCTPAGGVNRRRYGGWSPWMLVKIKHTNWFNHLHHNKTVKTTRVKPESANAASHPGFHYRALLYSNDMMHSGSVTCSAADVCEGSVSTGRTTVSAKSLKIPALLTGETVNLVV